MDAFLNLHRDAIVGTLSTFDRMIFKGHLSMLLPRGAFAVFLARQKVLLKEFGDYVQWASAEIKRTRKRWRKRPAGRSSTCRAVVRTRKRWPARWPRETASKKG